jgi:hypothetical protein
MGSLSGYVIWAEVFRRTVEDCALFLIYGICVYPVRFLVYVYLDSPVSGLWPTAYPASVISGLWLACFRSPAYRVSGLCHIRSLARGYQASGLPRIRPLSYPVSGLPVSGLRSMRIRSLACVCSVSGLYVCKEMLMKSCISIA